MKKVLTGASYTESRFAGIMHEAFVAHKGSLVPEGNVTIYGEGSIVTNKKTGELGLILDSESEYFEFVAQVHKDRLADVVVGDGWLDAEEELDLPIDVTNYEVVDNGDLLN